MNIEQLEAMLELTDQLWKLVDVAVLGTNSIKEDLIKLQTSIEGQLRILVYEKYKEEKG